MIIGRTSFKRYAQTELTNASLSATQLNLEITPAFYRTHTCHFSAIEVDCAIPTLDSYYSATVLRYGSHQKLQNHGRQRFDLRLPHLRARMAVKDLTLRLLPPGAEREIDPRWRWSDVIYDHKSDFLWPLRNLSNIGFANLTSLTIILVLKLYRNNDDQLCDLGIKLEVEDVIRRMGLYVEPTLAYEYQMADIWDMPPSPQVLPVIMRNERGSRGSGLDEKETTGEHGCPLKD
uniref:Uncharacterized protein n=1 Tax=Ramularia collo-cygni TaxID=112498 RepID=A0A2D3UW66_9PEZI